MPSYNPYPDLALSAAFDARPWAGVNVFDRGAVHVTVSPSAGWFESPVHFLNGLGSRDTVSLASAIQDESTFGTAAAWVFGVDSSDLPYVQADANFSITCGPGAAATFGFAAGSTDATSIGGGLYRVTAGSPWQRGVTAENLLIIIDQIGGAGSFFIPAISSTQQTSLAQSVPVAIRTRGTIADIDDTSYSLESVDDIGARWGVNDAGHVYCATLTDLAITALTWVDTALRDRLGFTGDEVPVGNEDTTVLTAANPCPGFLAPAYGRQNLVPLTVTNAATVDRTSGAIATQRISQWREWSLEHYIDGSAGDLDLWAHFREQFLPYAGPGDPLTVWLEWGDTRRGRSALYRPAATAPAYDLLYTTEDDGLHGRLRCVITSQQSRETACEWEGALTIHFLASWRLREMTAAWVVT